ncbi:prepilin-type N-terminal cleavage/methylation domain-containing protein [Jeotgalibacillus soli]|nr:prepilin-type N-terminal cleavage/methylation domain-containing protein [Jeotgalibacillus soli]
MSRLKKLHNDKGYTMAEVLIVLLLVSILIMISSHFIHRSTVMEESVAFEKQLIEDLHYAQLIAIKYKQHVNVQFLILDQQYYIGSSIGAPYQINIRRVMPASVRILDAGSLLSFRILPNGNTSTFGVIRFSVNEKPFAIHYYLSRGRFFIEK